MQNRSMGTNARSSRSPRTMFILMEYLESRQLLTVTVQPMLTLTPDATSTVNGYTPAQISQAYGYNLLSGNGSGQTIAIVDAYRDPNIVSDLHTFDVKFGLSDPTLSIVNETGGSANTVSTNSGWSTEIALDVEWAHAMASGAKILLVEANSSSITDLMAGVNYARNAAGVSVVSMSWGGSEFWGQQQYDNIFTTPAGHTGVTFVAASGDSGSWYGPMWPASSPNVLAVGGTVLHLNSSGGYGSETGWSYSTGGVSAIYSEPSYQTTAQNTGGRTTPDVAFNASGFALYSSVPDQGISGWSVVGGTSAGAPTWSALVAIADQLRVAAGKAALDGATGTLPALYAVYSPLGSVGYAAYNAAFNDITSGRSSYFMSAHPGYDGVTGLGSPKATQIMAQLVGAGTATASTANNAGPATAKMAKAAVVHQPPAAPNVVHLAAVTPANSPAPAAVAGLSASGIFDYVAPTSLAVLSTQAVATAATTAASPFYRGVTVTHDLTGGGLQVGPMEIEIPSAHTSVLKAAYVAADAAIPAIMATATPKFVYVNAMASMAGDNMASFVRESAALGAAISSSMFSGTSRATRVTIITLAVDAIITGLWAAHVMRKRKVRRRPAFNYGYPVEPPEAGRQQPMPGGR